MDRFSEFEALAAVVEQGSFTGAGRKLGVSKSKISKSISSLERRLGVQFLTRTTRRVNPTEIGLAYYELARRALTAAAEAEALVRSIRSDPSGLLRVLVPTDFGLNHLSPIIGSFLDQFPEITLQLVYENRFFELMPEEFDMAIYIGQLEENTIPAYRIAQTVNRVVASPAYLNKHGRPERIDDLTSYQLLTYSSDSEAAVWKLTASSGEKREVYTTGAFSINDGQSLVDAAVSGRGIAYLPSFLYAKPMADGLLEDVIPDLPLEIKGIHALHSEGLATSPKVRAFTDFLACRFSGKGPLEW